MSALLARLDSIRSRMWLGFGGVVLLVLVSAAVARSAMGGLSTAIGTSMADVQRESQLSSKLVSDVTEALNAGNRYVETRDTASENAFRKYGWDAHAAQRALNSLAGRTSEEIATAAAIDSKLSAIEVRYALAHRLADLGRHDDAHATAAQAQASVDALLADVQHLGQLEADKVANASKGVEGGIASRSRTLLVLNLLTVVLAIVVVFVTVRGIGAPLDVLVRHARRLSEGDLTARTDDALPGEFRILADAMNATGDSLSRIVVVAAETAQSVADSAHELSSVSEQISLSAGQMASAMVDVSHGAETQVQQLRTVDETLQVIREAAEGVQGQSTALNSLAEQIERSATAKRREIVRALGVLADVKVSVERAAAEVGQLNATAADIARFVQSVGQIAEQTNLLALNAAIEAARAGDAGRGFAVVADEVRTLAEQSQRAADDIVQMTTTVTERVTSSARAMESSASRVTEIERVSRDIDEALHAIGAAAEQTRSAATGVAQAAVTNANAVRTAAASIDQIARTAESHAAAAEEVNASTQEQSAACEQMTSASAVLLAGSTQLKELVGGLRTA